MNLNPNSAHAARDVAHELYVTYAGFHCTCGQWKIGSWNKPHEAFEAHVARAEAVSE